MKKASLALAGAFVFAVFACSSSNDDPPPLDGTGAPAGGVKLHEGTTYLDGELANVADVRADRVVFPTSTYAKLSKHKRGNILMSDRQRIGTGGKNPEGFLRKVVSVAQEADGVVVMTEPAMLQEAVDNLRVSGALDMPDLTTTGPQPLAGNIHPQAKGGTTIKLLDFSGKQLFEVKDVAKAEDGTDVPYIAHAAVETGTLAFTPKYDVDADVGFLELRSFKVKASGELDAALVLATGVKFDPALDPAVAAKIAGKPLKKTYSNTLADYDVSLGSLSAGAISLPASAHYTATLNCDFSFTAPVEAKVGGTAKGTLSAGLEYANGNLTPSFDKSLTVEPKVEFTKNGMMRAYCTVTPRIELKFFGVATASLTANAYAGAGASQTCGGKDAAGATQALVHGDAQAGASAKVFAEVNLFGLKWKKECTLFDVNASKQYDTTYPYPGGAAATCTVAGPFPLPPPVPANPSACFGSEDKSGPGAGPGTDPGPGPGTGDGGADAGDGGGLIPGTCTHDVCTAGDKLGQACDDCTMKVCAADPYCCDTFWGLSCFASVEKHCGKKCDQ
jgi:hypothetical protein